MGRRPLDNIDADDDDDDDVDVDDNVGGTGNDGMRVRIKSGYLNS